jgi:hypothetical protein
MLAIAQGEGGLNGALGGSSEQTWEKGPRGRFVLLPSRLSLSALEFRQICPLTKDERPSSGTSVTAKGLAGFTAGRALRPAPKNIRVLFEENACSSF